ncbi:MAG: LptF/LptG family permease [Cytophagales bacterium]|nr:LptF/LptG family permease [Bernardetiaceae bacterium]MDW8204099.1 LptF/LptG family permease [Cytophagales bacterium]
MLRFTKVDKLVSKAFYGIFLLSYAVVLFILLTFVMSQYFEDFVGKDLGWEVFAQLFFYFGLVLTPQALPLAVLLASLMAFGNLGENSEITAVKAAGIPLTRLMLPMGVYALLITVGAFLFNNHFAPYANLKAYSLMYDVRQKKPALEFKEGGFYTDLPDYRIRIERKSRSTDSIVYGVMIYDHTKQRGNTDVILADTGKIYTIMDNNFLVMELWNGNRFAEYFGQNTDRKEFVRDHFQKAKFVFSLAALGMQKTDEELFLSHKIMKNVSELEVVADSLNNELQRYQMPLFNDLKPYYDYQFNADRAKYPANEQDSVSTDFMQWKDSVTRSDVDLLFERALTKTRNIESLATIAQERISYYDKEERNFRLEQHHRFTMSVACLMMFLIGAPLGAIIKRGGLGVPVLVSIIFFIIFYVINISGSHYAKEGVTSVITGAWIADVVLLLFGIWFFRQAQKDSRLFDADAYLVWFGRIKSKWQQVLSKRLRQPSR